MLYYSRPTRVRLHKARTDKTGEQLIAALRGFLNAEEPVVIRWLQSIWGDQQDAVSYSDLAAAILEGALSLDFLAQWQMDYSTMITEKLVPKWRDAMDEAAKAHVKDEAFTFDNASPAIENWIEEHGTQLAVDLSTEQHNAMKAVIDQAAKGSYSVDELSRVMRPMIGLTSQQATSAQRYYDTLREEGLSDDKAQKKVAQYAAQAHRQRALTIARTELADAFNYGADQSVRQAQTQGYMPPQMEKKWMAAEDERECVVCGDLDGVTVPMDAQFPGGFEHPTAHPLCRCAVAYVEVDQTSGTS